jgi:hypothetical protein
MLLLLLVAAIILGLLIISGLGEGNRGRCRGEIDGLVMARKEISDRADGHEQSEIRPENFCGSEDTGSHSHGPCENRQKRSN